LPPNLTDLGKEFNFIVSCATITPTLTSHGDGPEEQEQTTQKKGKPEGNVSRNRREGFVCSFYC